MMNTRAGHMTLRNAVLGAILGAPVGLLVAFFIIGQVVHATARELVAPFLLSWFGFAVLSPLVYWADKRAAQSANPRFVTLKLVRYSLVGWLAFGYLLVSHGLITPVGCALLSLAVWWFPLALILWRCPRFLRRVIAQRHAARGGGGPG
jgi:hypothetical protein